MTIDGSVTLVPQSPTDELILSPSLNGTSWTNTISAIPSTARYTVEIPLLALNPGEHGGRGPGAEPDDRGRGDGNPGARRDRSRPGAVGVHRHRSGVQLPFGGCGTNFLPPQKGAPHTFSPTIFFLL